jgi:predicted type IV restriction endonuclease
MMRKQIKMASVEQILGETDVEKKPQFEVGTKFYLNGKSWIVIEARKEAGAEHRRLLSNFGDEQIVELHTLLKDRETPDFTFADLTENEKLFLKSMSQSNKKR